MKPVIRKLQYGVAVLATALAALPAAADKYPSRPVTLVSPLPAGASTDVVTRAWINCVDKLAGQPFVLQNKPGANGVVAAQAMKQLPLDGYSIMVGGMSQTTITPFIFKRQPYDPEKDFEGAAMFGVSSLVMVASAQSGIRSINDMVAVAKASPKGIDIGIPAVASPAHLLSAAVAGKLGIKSELVPLAGEGGGITALLGGQLPVMVFLTGSASQYIDSGSVNIFRGFESCRICAPDGVDNDGNREGARLSQGKSRHSVAGHQSCRVDRSRPTARNGGHTCGTIERAGSRNGRRHDWGRLG